MRGPRQRQHVERTRRDRIDGKHLFAHALEQIDEIGRFMAADRVTGNAGGHRDAEGRPTVTVAVTNTGDRPVQVGSHYHFVEVNPALDDGNATAELAVDLVESLFGKSTLMRD